MNDNINVVWKYLQVLVKCATTLQDANAVSNIVNWGMSVESVIEQLENESESNPSLLKMFEDRILSTSAPLIELKTKMDINALSCARHLLLRSLLFSNFPSRELFSNVFREFLSLNPDDPTAARKHLAGDISKRLMKDASVRNLLLVNSHLVQTIRNHNNQLLLLLKNQNQNQIQPLQLDEDYKFRNLTIQKKACARLILRDMTRLYSLKADKTKEAAEKRIWQTIDNSCLKDVSSLVSLKKKKKETKNKKRNMNMFVCCRKLFVCLYFCLPYQQMLEQQQS